MSHAESVASSAVLETTITYHQSFLSSLNLTKQQDYDGLFLFKGTNCCQSQCCNDRCIDIHWRSTKVIKDKRFKIVF